MINNVLITGSQGYIGTNLCDYIRKNSDVNIYHADKSTGTPVEYLDVLQNIDFVVHLAAYPGVYNCNENFDAAITDNVCSAFSVFRTAQKNKVPVIFTSSQAAKDPFNNLYSSIKAAIEIEARRCNSVGGDIRIIRLSNVYGGQGFMERKFTVVRNFLKAYKDEKEMVINGNGSQVRDFIHVKDVCKAIFKYMMLKTGWNYPIDIGTGIGTSVLDLAKMIDPDEKLFTFNKSSDIIGPQSSIVDPKEAFDKLNFVAKRKLHDEIDKYKRGI
jgi:UDP-glucose 4-epimerase